MLIFVGGPTPTRKEPGGAVFRPHRQEPIVTIRKRDVAVLGDNHHRRYAR